MKAVSPSLMAPPWYKPILTRTLLLSRTIANPRNGPGGNHTEALTLLGLLPRLGVMEGSGEQIIYGFRP